MKLKFLLFVMVIAFTACKSEPKKATEISVDKEIKKSEADLFDEQLIDVRSIDEEFVEGYKVQKFGIQKIKDSIYEFVFRLDSLTTNTTVEAYSVGVRGFNAEEKEPFNASFSPNLKLIDEGKYIMLRRNINNLRYFDSIDVYIYERKNWKKSGRLGSIKIRDILFED